MNKRIYPFVFAAGLLLATPWVVGLELARQTIDGGGVMRSSSGQLSLSGTVGQFDASSLTGGSLELAGGFWFPEPPGDCNADGIVDLLDLGDDVDCWEGPVGGLPAPPCNCFDFDDDGDVDLRDFSRFQVFFTS